MLGWLESWSELRAKTQWHSLRTGWLPSLVEIPSTHVSCRTAHRVPACPPKPEEPASPFLFKLPNFWYRDIILTKVRTMSASLITEYMRVSLYPDFSMDLQRRRVMFIGVKQWLSRLNVTYPMLYPARFMWLQMMRLNFLIIPLRQCNGWTRWNIPWKIQLKPDFL